MTRIYYHLILSFILVGWLPIISSYQVNESIPLFVNKVGPYYNPQETYHYYSLPVCRPERIHHKPLTLGEVLDGDRMAYSLYEIKEMMI